MTARIGLALLLWPMSALAGDLIGMTIPPYPHGLRDMGGTCVSDKPGYDHICDYSIGVLADEGADDDATLRYVIVGRMAGRDGQQARWLITDAADYPKTESGFHLQTGTCRFDGKDDDRVIAVVRDDITAETLVDVAWARRIELPDGRLSLLNPARVDCLNEAYLGL